MKTKSVPEQSWSKAPALFAVLMAINVASYTLCVPMMVMIPFSMPKFCEFAGIDCWGMDVKSIAGNFLLGIAFQITVEALASPLSYKISTKVRQSIME